MAPGRPGWARHHSRRTEQAYVFKFLTSLATDRDVLGVALPWLDGIVRAKRPVRLPAVLAREEVRAVLQRLDGVPRLMACLLHGGKGDRDRLTPGADRQAAMESLLRGGRSPWALGGQSVTRAG